MSFLPPHSLSVCLCTVDVDSFATAVSEVTRGTSAGSGGKGHVKSASVSSPGPSAENGAPADPLGPRYPIETTVCTLWQFELLNHSNIRLWYTLQSHLSNRSILLSFILFKRLFATLSSTWSPSSLPRRRRRLFLDYLNLLLSLWLAIS